MKKNTSLFILIFIAQTLLVNELPLWASLSAAGFWLWRLVAQFFRLQPQRWLTGLFSIVFLIVTLAWFRSAFDKDVATTYLLVLSSLKILEYRDEAETQFIILLGLFLAISKFLFTYDLIFSLAGLSLVFAFLYQLLPTSWSSKTYRFKFFYLGKIFIYALPATVVLFFLFPRLQSSGLGLYGISQTGQSGFSDELRPGSISEVIKSNELAFHAEFYSLLPASENLYWRGQVLTESDNFHWRKSNIAASFEFVNDHVIQWDYKIILEPHQNRWIFTYDSTRALSINSVRAYRNTKTNVYAVYENIQSRISYLGQIRKRSNEKKSLAISTPEFRPSADITKYKNDEQVASLVKSLKATSRKESAAKILNYYVQNNFKYTLTPGAEDQTIRPEKRFAHFLFNTKQGFCEYYASATATLLQLLDIPARVVIGYQGGEFNEVGRFFAITQKDAHAWVEYLNEEQEWVRLDPTQVVAPERLQLGGVNFERKINSNVSLITQIKNLITDNFYINQVSLFASLMNYQWNMFLLDFDRDQQAALIDLIKTVFLQIIIALFAIAFLILVLQLYHKRRVFSRTKDQLAFEFESFMNKQKMPRLKSEGPLEWQTRTLQTQIKSPQLQRQVDEVFQEFMRLYFSDYRDISKAELKIFRKKLIALSHDLKQNPS